MTDLRKAAEMALEALTLMNQDIEKHRATLPVGRQSELCKASLALRQALAQPEQVLTARVVVSGSEHKPWCDSVTKLLLSYPPQIPSCNCKQEQGSSSPNYPISESSTSLDKIVEIAIQGHASTRDAIRWAMQQEREACAKLVEADGLARGDEGLVLIKAAGRIRARSEKPPVKSYCGGKPNYCTSDPHVDDVKMSQERVDETAKREHEPYPEGDVVGPCICGSWPGGKCLKCKRIEPPKREWVGLTHEERDEIDQICRSQMEALFAIEAKLKEKNT